MSLRVLKAKVIELEPKRVHNVYLFLKNTKNKDDRNESGRFIKENDNMRFDFKSIVFRIFQK